MNDWLLLSGDANLLTLAMHILFIWFKVSREMLLQVSQQHDDQLRGWSDGEHGPGGQPGGEEGRAVGGRPQHHTVHPGHPPDTSEPRGKLHVRSSARH